MAEVKKEPSHQRTRKHKSGPSSRACVKQEKEEFRGEAEEITEDTFEYDDPTYAAKFVRTLDNIVNYVLRMYENGVDTAKAIQDVAEVTIAPPGIPEPSPTWAALVI